MIAAKKAFVLQQNDFYLEERNIEALNESST